MRHWTEEFDDDSADEPLVRPYTITSGRTVPDRHGLTLITLVTAVPEAAAQAGPGPLKRQPEHRTILTLCPRPTAVAEIASALGLPVSLTKILIGDLIDAGQVRASVPRTFNRDGGLPDRTILEAVRDGLRKL